MKTCQRCKLGKAPSEFYRDRSSADGLQHWCKQCHNEHQRRYDFAHAKQRRRYRWDNSSRIVEKARAWQEDHPGWLQAKRRGAAVCDLARHQWEACQAEFDHRCAYCGERPDALTIDHIVPISRGGGHTVSNVVPACRSCNARKHAGDVAWFKAQLQNGERDSDNKTYPKHSDGEA